MAFRLEWDTPNGAVEAIELDCAPHITWEGTAEIAEHAVERGSNVADHVRPNNPSITVEGIVSNAPLFQPSTQMLGITGSVQPVALQIGGRTVSVNVFKFDADYDRVVACDGVLEALRTTSQLCRVISGFRSIEDVVLTRYAVDQSVEGGDALNFTLELKKLRLVTTSRVAAPRPQRRRAQARVTRGPAQQRTALLNGAVSAGIASATRPH